MRFLKRNFLNHKIQTYKSITRETVYTVDIFTTVYTVSVFIGATILHFFPLIVSFWDYRLCKDASRTLRGNYVCSCFVLWAIRVKISFTMLTGLHQARREMLPWQRLYRSTQPRARILRVNRAICEPLFRSINNRQKDNMTLWLHELYNQSQHPLWKGSSHKLSPSPKIQLKVYLVQDS